MKVRKRSYPKKRGVGTILGAKTWMPEIVRRFNSSKGFLKIRMFE